MPLALIVHGGAWAIPDDEVEPHVRGCHAALEIGWRVLDSGGAALDAVQAAVVAMENDPAFNAGVGSVLNRDGIAELDSAIIDGASLNAGAAAALRRIRNPVVLARRLLASPACLLVAEGAERFAQDNGIALCDPSDLIVERERRRWEELRRRGAHRTNEAFAQQPTMPLQNPADTVGAVALDRRGNLAAACSTGGTANKLPGRIGDSPLIGAGLYADNRTGACCSTGWGESIIKVLLAKTATDLIGAGCDPAAAAQEAVDLLKRRVGGLGGCVLLDREGRVGLAFNTPRMAYAYRAGDGRTAEDVE